jgi:hypothetical protein
MTNEPDRKPQLKQATHVQAILLRLINVVRTL